jgi:hypothetical protein
MPIVEEDKLEKFVYSKQHSILDDFANGFIPEELKMQDFDHFDTSNTSLKSPEFVKEGFKDGSLIKSPVSKRSSQLKLD